MALGAKPQAETPLGLYLHIPFCRKRCMICYFRVYTDKNARDVDVYRAEKVRSLNLATAAGIVLYEGLRQLQAW